MPRTVKRVSKRAVPPKRKLKVAKLIRFDNYLLLRLAGFEQDDELYELKRQFDMRWDRDDCYWVLSQRDYRRLRETLGELGFVVREQVAE